MHPAGIRLCLEYGANGRPVEHKAVKREARGLLNPDGSHLTDAMGNRLFATGPQGLQTVVETLRPNYRRPNSKWWEHWRVERNGGDLGTMAEVRERWHNARIAARDAAAAATATATATGDNEDDEEEDTGNPNVGQDVAAPLPLTAAAAATATTTEDDNADTIDPSHSQLFTAPETSNNELLDAALFPPVPELMRMADEQQYNGDFNWNYRY